MRRNLPAPTLLLITLNQLLLVCLGVLVARDTSTTAPASVLLLVLTMLAGALAGPLAGLAAGVLAGAAFVHLRLDSGTWLSGDRTLLLATLAGLLAAGWLAGLLAGALRPGRPDGGGADGSSGTAGLLEPAEAVALVEAEQSDPRTAGPLAVLLVRATPRQLRLPDEAARAHRAAARALQVATTGLEVPFEAGPDTLGVVLRGITGSDAQARAAELLDRVGAAGYGTGEHGERRLLAEHCVLRSGLATADGKTDRGSLVDTALRTLETGRVPAGRLVRTDS